jgi:hypothetical protein
VTDASQNTLRPQSAIEASEVGFIQGESLRKTGSKPAHLEFKMDMEIGDFATSPFADYWRAGFRAGYLGEPKPQVRPAI